MKPFARAGFRHLARHGAQLGLTVLGVTLGVGLVVAMDLGIQSAREAFRISSETIAGRATHRVTGGSSSVPDSLVALLRRQPGVEAAAPVVETVVSSPALPGRALRLLGVDPLAEGPFRPYLTGSGSAGGRSAGAAGDEDGGARLLTGSPLLTEPRGVLLSRSTATEAGVGIGDTLRIRRGSESEELTVVGILDPADERSRLGLADLLVMDIAAAQDALERAGSLDRVDLRLAGELSAVDAASIAESAGSEGPQELRSLLPQGTRLESVGTRERTMMQMIRAFDLNLTALSLLGLVFGFFLIYNTMTFSVVQRRRTLGLFRALGTTRGAVVRGILLEAVLIGVAGSVAGLLVGIVLGRGLVRLVGRTINDLYFTVSVESLALPPEVLVKGFLLGVGAAALAAVPPAWEAARVTPREALRRSAAEDRARRNVRRAAWLGLASVGMGGALMTLPGAAIGLAFAGLFAVILGMALLTPAATVGSMRLLRPPLVRLTGVLGGMAARGVVTALSRTAPAMAALVIAVSVTIGLGVMIGSFRSSVEDWLDATLRADLYVSAPSSGSARVASSLPPGLAEEVREIPGVRGVSENRVRELGAAYPAARLMALRLSDVDRGAAGLDLMETVGADAVRRFRGGEGVLVSEPFAFRYGLGSGDTLRLDTDGGALRVPVLGIFRDYASESGTVALTRDLYDRYWNDPESSSLAVFVAAGADEPAIEDAIRAAVPGVGAVQVRSNRILRELSLEVFDRTFAITRVLRLLAFVVAFIGVLSALMALQLEREREFGVLRAVGMTPRQSWGLITGQTGIMGMVAGLLAVPVGLVLAAVMVFVVNQRSFGWSMRMEVDPIILLQGVLLALAGAVLAGVGPSRRIARTSPAAALRGE